MSTRVAVDTAKDEAIRKLYYGKNGLRSPQGTYQDAREKGLGITYAYVRDWFKRNFDRTRPTGGGKNSFVAQGPYQESQTDLFYITPKQMPKQQYKYGISVIDIFTKRATVVHAKSKTIKDWMRALRQSFVDLGGKPKMVMTDKDGTLMFGRKTQIEPELERLGIDLVMTAGAPHFVERFHRTFKNMLLKSMESAPQVAAEERNNFRKHKITEKTAPPPTPPTRRTRVLQWHTFIPGILKQYNTINVHSSTGKTPIEASKETSTMDVKANLEVRAMKGRKYPPIVVNDMVRVIRKKVLGDKEHSGNTQGGAAKQMEASNVRLGQKFYKLNDDMEYIRSDTVKMDR